MVIEHRRKRLGRDVVVLDPANPVNGFNVLDGIETSIKRRRHRQHRTYAAVGKRLP